MTLKTLNFQLCYLTIYDTKTVMIISTTQKVLVALIETSCVKLLAQGLPPAQLILFSLSPETSF